jgi:hypothetical protein
MDFLSLHFRPISIPTNVGDVFLARSTLQREINGISRTADRHVPKIFRKNTRENPFTTPAISA